MDDMINTNPISGINRIKAKTPRGRFAPSPTGRMHLGNAWAALLSWLSIRSQSGEMVLRIENLDRDRSKAAYRTQLIEDLAWLGLDWDEGPKPGDPLGPYDQSERLDRYEAALAHLRDLSAIYPCFCTRADRMAVSAPHRGETQPSCVKGCMYLSPGEAERASQLRNPSWRMIAPDQTVHFQDLNYGPRSGHLQTLHGDLLLRRADGVFAYQLAVVVDDCEMGITQVVRGSDLLDATPAQIYLMSLLGFAPPVYGHVPLLTDACGNRLSKRHAALDMGQLQNSGASAEQIIGFLAWKAGLIDAPKPVQPSELIPEFAWSKLGRADVVVEDHFSMLKSTL